jgi:hypothetical protein
LDPLDCCTNLGESLAPEYVEYPYPPLVVEWGEEGDLEGLVIIFHVKIIG